MYFHYPWGQEECHLTQVWVTLILTLHCGKDLLKFSCLFYGVVQFTVTYVIENMWYTNNRIPATTPDCYNRLDTICNIRVQPCTVMLSFQEICKKEKQTYFFTILQSNNIKYIIVISHMIKHFRSNNWITYFFSRMAAERDLEKSEAINLGNIIFDESGYFVLYATMLGVKVVNLYTNKCVRIIGKPENLRPLKLALHQVSIDLFWILWLDLWLDMFLNRKFNYMLYSTVLIIYMFPL